jgi:putative heme-binding domain-containing protein
MPLPPRFFIVLFLFCNAVQAQDPYGEFVAHTPARTPAEEQKCFHLPKGFAIELVASEPAIIKPINMNFDDRGRLWVTQSVEYPFPAKDGSKARDTVKVLDLSEGTGLAERVTTFAGGLNIPIGVLPIANGAIVYSIPNIWGLHDTHGTGQADKREILYSSYGHRDTHGMTGSFTWGFDGWVYACHGFSNTSVVKAKDGSTIEMNSGNTYRFRADGSHVEQFTHGQVNPFGLTFDPLGNLYSADCHTRPIMMLLRDGYYDSFGKPHDGLGYAPDMCDHDHGSTAISGIVYYAANQFPAAYHDHVFMGNVVTNRINHDRLEKHGSTLKAIEQPDFLTCDDPWFRPVDLKLGPDGAIYVADFYNRIIGHYEVPLTHPGRDHERGRIWRIVYRGPDGNGKPMAFRADWNKATIAELVGDLANPNLVVRMKAMSQLVQRGGADVIEAVKRVMQPTSEPTQRVHGLWVLERLHALDDRLLETAFHDSESGVRVHAMRILAARTEMTASQRRQAELALRDPEAFVQRTAAEALGRHPSAESLVALLALRHEVPADDTHLLYVVRKALRDHLRPETRLLDKDGLLTSEVLKTTTLTEKDWRALADVAPGIASPDAAAFLMNHLKRFAESDTNLARYIHHVARYGRPPVVDALLVFARASRPEDLRHQAALFRSAYQGTQERGAQLNSQGSAWAEQLVGRLLSGNAADLLQTGADLANSLHMAKVESQLNGIATNKTRPEAARRAALDALLAIAPGKYVGYAGALLADSTEPNGLREHAARVLAGANQAQARKQLLDALAVAPASLQTVIAAALAGNAQSAADLVKAVAAGKASPRLLQDWWVHIQISKHASLTEEVARLTKSLPAADKRLQELIDKRRNGLKSAKPDPARGALVFQKSCAICHQIAGKGAKVGPQLDGVGNRGLDRLLEDIIDPNRNVDLAFRSSSLLLKSGQIVTGLVLREEGQIVVIADNQGKEVRIPRSNIEERSVSALSPMPANLLDEIPEADFYALLAYLLTQRAHQ